MRIAIVGVTGMVGRVMLKVLAERKFPITELIPVASEMSVGKTISYLKNEYTIISLNDMLKKDIDLALFSAGGEVSKVWAPKLATKGCKVIDNSSFWRMHKNYKLIIPEINGGALTKEDLIIANPNCSTIQLLMVLAPLHKKFGVKRVVVSTYQSITGTGKKAVEQLENEEQVRPKKRLFFKAIIAVKTFLFFGETTTFFSRNLLKGDSSTHHPPPDFEGGNSPLQKLKKFT